MGKKYYKKLLVSASPASEHPMGTYKMYIYVKSENSAASEAPLNNVSVTSEHDRF